MVGRRFFGRGDKLNPSGESSSRSARRRFLLAFHLTALATVVLPWFIFGFVRSMRGEAASGDAENQNGWWWSNNDDAAEGEEGEEGEEEAQEEQEQQEEEDNGGEQDQEDNADEQEGNGEEENNNERRLWWWNNNREGNEEWDEQRERTQRLIVLTFVYMWSLMVFGVLLCYANVAFTSRPELTTALLAALVMFANLALMCCVLVETSGLLNGDDERMAEEYEEVGGWFGTFAGGLVGITFFLWFLWSTIMALWIYCTQMRSKRGRQSKIGSRDDGSWYSRQEDGVYT